MDEKRNLSASALEAVKRIGDAAATESQDLEALSPENKARIEAGTRTELELLELQQKQAEIDLQKAQVKNYEQDIELRQEYSRKLFRLLLGWTAGLWGFLFLQGFRFLNFAVDSKVALGVVINVTVAVVGLFLVVTKNLFPSRDSAAASKGGSKEPKN